MEYSIKTSLDANRRTDGEILNYYRNECEDVVGYFLEFYYQLPKIVLSIAILIEIFLINPVFAAVSLFPTVMMVILVNVLSRRIFMYRTRSRKNTRKVTGFLNSFFGNIEFFYMIGNRDRLISVYDAKCRKRSKSEIKDRVLDSLLGAVSSNSSDIALGIILLIALPFMMSGRFSTGEFVMFGYYYAFLANMPDAVANLAKRRKQTAASLERIQFLFQEDAPTQDSVSIDRGYEQSRAPCPFPAVQQGTEG